MNEDFDRKSFLADLESHRAYLLRFATRQCSNPDLAEDLVQNTYLRAISGRIQHNANMKAWLIKILLNVFFDEIYRRKREENHMLNANLLYGHDTSCPSHESGLNLEVIENAMDKLSQERQEILLAAALGYSEKELVERLALPKGTVKSRLSRARKQFLEELSPEETLFENNRSIKCPCALQNVETPARSSAQATDAQSNVSRPASSTYVTGSENAL